MFGTVRPPARRWGSISRRIAAGSGSWIATAWKSLRKAPCRDVPLPKIEREEMRFSPRRDRRPGRGHPCPLPGAGVRRRLRRPADRGAGRAPPKPRRPVGRAVTVAEILTEVNGKLITGPPKTRADRRTVGLPPFVVGELEAHLAAAQRPGSHVFTAPGGGPLRVPRFPARFGCRRPRQPACRAGASTTFATPPWRCGWPQPRRPRRSPCAGHTSVTFTWTATATRRSPAGRGGPMPSSKGLDFEVHHHGRKPQDARSPG